jgi:hypothetical protein
MRSPWTWLIFLVLLLAPQAGRADDIYAYEKDGQLWFTNQKCPKGAKKCRLVMKGWTKRDTEQPPEPSGNSKPRSSRRTGPWTPPEGNDLDPLDANERAASPHSGRVDRAFIDETIRQAARRYSLPEAFVRAIIQVESSFKVKALSYKGAMGLMQLMPGTAKDMGVTDPWDPYQNIMGGTRFLRVLANRFNGDLPKVISAYHAGGGAVSQRGGIPFEGTDSYVRRVLDHYYRFKAELEGAQQIAHPAESDDEADDAPEEPDV